MTFTSWIAGSLNGNPRGRRLADMIGASASESTPEGYGLCLLTGDDFLASDSDWPAWAAWSQEPGRALVVLPPFNLSDYSVPTIWGIRSAEGTKKSTGHFANQLSSEVRYEVVGRLQVPDHLGGRWDDGSMNTGYYKKHPNSGLFVVTCLPLWSLSLLEASNHLVSWLQAIYELVGHSAPHNEEQPELFELSRMHYAVLLHLCSSKFADRHQALAALDDSSLFKISNPDAKVCLAETEAQGLTLDGKLTDTGWHTLEHSPFGVYAVELTRMNK